MKIFLPLILFIFSSAYGATCTNTTRTNYTSNQVLTSSALNADFNQLVTKANALDGGCVTDGTLEYTALDSSLDAVKNGIQQGCALSYVDANTVSVGKCIASVNGYFIKTTATNNVTWGCTSCSAEVVSTQYYVYAKTGSSGTTLNLLISTVAPNADGYDSSNNRVLGRFYNNSSSAIEQYSIDSWDTSGYSRADGKNSTPGATHSIDSFSFSFGTTDAVTVCSASPCSYLDQLGSMVSSITLGIAGTYTVNLNKTYQKVKCWGNVSLAASAGFMVPIQGSATNTLSLNTTAVNGTTGTNAYGTVHCEGY